MHMIICLLQIKLACITPSVLDIIQLSKLLLAINKEPRIYLLPTKAFGVLTPPYPTPYYTVHQHFHQNLVDPSDQANRTKVLDLYIPRFFWKRNKSSIEIEANGTNVLDLHSPRIFLGIKEIKVALRLFSKVLRAWKQWKTSKYPPIKCPNNARKKLQ